MDDDMYPNDGAFMGGVPLEPRDQVIDRKKEKAQTLEALKLAEHLIQHFDERIAFRDSVESINVDIEKAPALHQKIFQVHKLLKEALQEEKELLEEQIEMYGPK